jgi:hypothetical protein
MYNLKSLLSVIFFSSMISLTNGQKNYFTYKTATYDQAFSFPLFLNPADSFSTEKINQHLQISELEILKGFETKNIFEKISAGNGTIYGAKVGINFNIHNNTDKCLSIRFNESSCGTTCFYWVKYYNFNSGNGDLIQLKDLFTEQGYKEFYRIVTKKCVAQFKRELKKIDSARRDFLSGIIDCYDSNDWNDFYIKDSILYVDGENCFSKGQKFFGLETVSGFKLVEFKSYLNDYGRCLFSITQDSIGKYRSNMLPQLFQGTIADRNILFVLKPTGDKNEMMAEYVYLKRGKGIFLKGRLEKTSLTLTEKNPAFEDFGFIDATFDGQQITGTWANEDKSKSYRIFLTRK